MTTRAVIAVSDPIDSVPAADAEPTGFLAKLFGRKPKPKFRGVYLHNAGGPSDVGPLLHNVVRVRHSGDVAAAARELVDENAAGWSSLHYFCDEDAAKNWNGTKLTVDAHQAYFDRDEPAPGPASYQGDPQRDLGFRAPPIDASSDKMGAVFVYLLSKPELVVFVVGEDGVSITEVARVPWSASPDWDAADAAVARAFGDDESEDDDD